MNLFNSTPTSKPKRNVFDLSHERKFSLNMGDLVPIMCQEVVPGDTFKLNTEILMRMAPMIAPVMHRVNVYTHYFFVPNRLVWNEWKDFITGGEDGKSTPVFPKLDLLNVTDSARVFFPGSLADYLGFPVVSKPGDIHVGDQWSALPFRAYQLIYNEYYRDQNLEPPVKLSLSSGLVSGADSLVLSTLRRRAWEKDYFTSALPWAQRGGEVRLPLTGDADIVHTPGAAGIMRDKYGNPLSQGDAYVGSNGQILNFDPSGGDRGAATSYDPSGTLTADLSNVTSATINDLRTAVQLQKWLERQARGGSRYIETILSHFGVRSSDSRLQRPEYLGGGKSPVLISEVLQTSSSDPTTPQGNMSGHGISVGNTHEFTKYFEEHGMVIGIMSVLPRSSYQQGLPRQFFKFDRFDYFWPEFAHLGEQSIANKELFYNFNNSDNQDATFGYQSRYSEYKYQASSVHGDFRTNLAFWHLGRIFNNQPTLTEEFVQTQPDEFSRIFAVSDPKVHKLYCQIYHNFRAIRPMPKFGVPGF